MSTTIPSSSRASGVRSSVAPQFGYDRTHLIEFIATASPSSTLNTNIDPSNATTTEPIAGTVSGGSAKKASVNLYASALSQLATELAKVPNVAWEKVARLCALCPSVPPTSTSASTSEPSGLEQCWQAMSETFKKANQTTNDAEDDSDDSDDESDEEDEQQSSSKNIRINWKYTPGQLAVTESNDVLDTRIDAVWALARYLILSHASSSSSVADLHTSHVDRILPVLLRIFISLPYYRYDRVNVPHV
mgnify:FL=1